MNVLEISDLDVEMVADYVRRLEIAQIATSTPTGQCHQLVLNLCFHQSINNIINSPRPVKLSPNTAYFIKHTTLCLFLKTPKPHHAHLLTHLLLVH